VSHISFLSCGRIGNPDTIASSLTRAEQL